MHRPTATSTTRRRRLLAGTVGVVLAAGACSATQDDATTGAPVGLRAAAAPTTAAPDDTGGTATTAADDSGDTSAPETTGATTGATGDTTGTAVDEAAIVADLPTQSTLPAPEGDPVMGGRLVVAGEAETGTPWTPANSQCDSFCQLRIRTFIEPLFVVNNDLEVTGWLAESIEPNADSTEFTITLRPGITFTDGTPLNAEAVIDNLNRNWSSLLQAGAMRDIAKYPDGTIITEIVDDLTFKLFTGKNGNLDQPVRWYQFPYFITGQPGFVGSPAWLAEVDENPDLATQPIGTGPFVMQEYLPGDRMLVVRNPDYWRTDEAGNQLPYLDEIEFRVIVDSQVRAQALESGDVDLISTADPLVVSQYVDNDDFVMLQQNVRTETAYVMFHLTQPQFQDRDVRCALIQAVDRQALIDSVYAGFPQLANGPFSPGQDGYLEDTGLPEYDPEAAAATIEAWEAENGPLEFTYSTTPTGTTKATADFLQQAWSQVGVDVEQAAVEQSALIGQALTGAPEFFAFGWRNHAGLWVDTQNSWWHGFGADAAGSEVVDGGLNLNFGRLNDPVINDLLDQARETADPDERRALAQDINREFAEQCWIMPTYWVSWGIIMDPAVQNIGRDPLPDGSGYAADGAGFPGQVWLGSVFVTE